MKFFISCQRIFLDLLFFITVFTIIIIIIITIITIDFDSLISSLNCVQFGNKVKMSKKKTNKSIHCFDAVIARKKLSVPFPLHPETD